MEATIWTVAGVDFGIQLLAGIHAIVFKTEKYYDLLGSSTFLLLVVWTFLTGTQGTASQVNTAFVATWALRLGSFLFTRVLNRGEDRRFRKAKTNPPLFLFMWFMQGVWVFVTSMPSLFVNLADSETTIGTPHYIGWALWIFGFAFEVVADRQKSAFRSIEENSGKFITTGLWSISRHPNYFGEILLWTGLYIAALPTLSGWQHIAVISPIFLTWLLTQLSGIPMLERYADKKWGDDPEYKAYKQKTKILIPFVW